MPDPEFVGLCGRNPIESCRLVWHNEYANRIGSYPSDLLPSRRTTWHATSNSSFSFSPPLVVPGMFGPFAGFLMGFGFTPPQNDIFMPKSHFIVSFVKIANRIDATHIITEEEIESISSDGLLSGEMIIDVGEYIMEFLAVTDEAKVVEKVATEQGGLTESELSEIGRSGETEQDRVFRKLLTLTYPGNRFVNIYRNVLGIEYRLDNGGPKAVSALKSAGTGDILTASYRDGSSKKITIQSEVNGETLQAGDVVYLSYIAIKEHYMRQSVIITWGLHANSLPPVCFSFSNSVKVASYRFYEWQIAPDESPLLLVTLSGWRVVETHNIPVNFVAAVGTVSDAALGDYIIGGVGRSVTTRFLTTSYMPALVTETQLMAYISDRSTLPQYIVQQTWPGTGSERYHINAGAQGNTTAFRNAEWWTRANFRFAASHSEGSEHVFFNVHPEALAKRDVDKFGIERTMAEQIQEDIDNGKLTFFPFMDDAIVDVPTNGANEFLDSSNTKFEPIEPVTGYGSGNTSTECHIGGATTLLYSGGPDDIIGQFVFDSNFISEKFDLDTKVIVERHFSGGQVGMRFVSLQGVGSPGKAISCTGDPSRGFAFTVHANGDSNLSINTFKLGPTYDALSLLVYRPDLASPPVVGNNEPIPSQFERRIGYSGMIGDRPGFDPGRVMSTSSFVALSGHRYTTTSDSTLQSTSSLTDDQITAINIIRQDNKVTIPLGLAFHGRTEIIYTYDGDPFETMLIFRVGGGIEGVVDSVLVAKGEARTLSVDHRWMKGDTIEFVGEKIPDMEILSVTVSQLTEELARDFSENVNSSTAEDANLIASGSLMETRQFFETDVMSIGEDERSRLFVFFNDKNDGISCIQSDDFGGKWFFHYGIIEKIGGHDVRHPFIVNAFESNRGFLFFSIDGKILCKVIRYPLLHFGDAFIIERFEQDILDTSGNIPKEKAGLLSNDAKRLRHRIPAYVAAGDLTNAEFLGLLGKQIVDGDGVVDPYELRDIERIETDNLGQQTLVTERKQVLKKPIVLGSNTAFTNKDVNDIYFSAYRTDKGVLRLLFHGFDDASNLLALQFHFSSDNGMNWYDNLEYIEYKFNRLRVDSQSRTQFIDRESDGSPPPDIEKVNPLEGNQTYPFGLFIHGYRRTTSETGDVTENAVEIDSPYVFYQTTTQKVFVFYVLTGVLLCKIFPDSIFEDSAGISEIKQIIERDIRSQFVDGNLTDPLLLSDLYQYIDPDTRTRNEDGLISFPYLLGQEGTEPTHLGLKNFDNNRNISTQRVCAYELPNANVRMFYKLDGSNALRAATWNGSFWMVEEFLRDPHNFTDGGIFGTGG